MGSRVRFSLLALLVGALVGVSAPAAMAAVEIEKFVAVNCAEGHEGCGEETFGSFSIPKEPSQEEAEESSYTQAAGHVPFGVTDFKVTTTGSLEENNQKPTGVVTHVRTDVAPGLATNPFATEQCTMAEFDGGKEEEALPETGFYAPPKCGPESKIGENKVTVFAEGAGDIPLTGNVYNLVQPEGLASDFGVALKLPIPLTKIFLQKAFAEHPLELPEPEKAATEKFLEEQQYYAHTLIEGSVEWGKQANGTNQGDYHDYFEINVSPVLELISSRLVFYGRSGEGDFVTNPTSCPGNNTTTLHVTEKEGAVATQPYTALVGLNGCSEVPFAPTFSLAPATTALDQPDGFTAEVGIPHYSGEEEIDSSQLKTAVIKLPEGMTLNPSAAAELTACSPAEARIHSATPGVGCAKSSELGTVSLDVPTLPPGALKGSVYLGGPETGPITAPPYTVYLDAESARYGVSVRVKGEVTPNETTGQLTTVFSENPEQPFTNVKLQFKGGALAPVANPLACGAAKTETTLTPIAKPLTSATITDAFTVDSDDNEGACASPTPFAPTQSNATQAPNGGAHTNYTFTLQRSDGQQYLSKLSTELPAGSRGRDPDGAVVQRSPGVDRKLLGGKPDRHGDGQGGLGADAVHVHRLGLHDRTVRGGAVRAVHLRAGRRRAVQPRQRDHPRDDQRRPEDRAA